jgi:hypothetical protein
VLKIYRIIFLCVLAFQTFIWSGCNSRTLNEDSSDIITDFPESLLDMLELNSNVDINNDGWLSEFEAGMVKSLDLSSYALDELSWLDELRYFTGLETLKITSAITAIDLTNQRNLESLTLTGTSLAGTLDLTAQTRLTYLVLTDSAGIDTLDIHACTKLQQLDIRGCAIKNGLGDFSSFTALTALKIHRLQETNNVEYPSHQSDYTKNNNNVTINSSSFTNASQLTELMAEDCSIASLDLAKCTSLKNLYLEVNSLDGVLDLSNCANISVIQVNGNPGLTEIRLPSGTSISNFTGSSKNGADSGVVWTN